MNSWQYKKISGSYLPRQFEYHPDNNSLLFGCMDGSVYLSRETVPDPVEELTLKLGNFGNKVNDVILGLCWFRHHPDR